MRKTESSSVHAFLTRWVSWASHWAKAISLTAFLLTAIFGYYAATNLSIQTDTDEMIDPNLPFRQAYRAFDQTFPQFADSFLIVIDGENVEAAEIAARRLTEKLTREPQTFRTVYASGMGQFFDQNGLLYLDTEELSDLVDRLADAQPVLTALVQDPSLRGFFDILTLGVEDTVEDGAPTYDMARIFDEIAPVAEAVAAGADAPLSWQRLLESAPPTADELRRFILVQPVQDFAKLQPAKAALTRTRSLAGEVTAELPGQVTVRFTGKIALNTEELKSVSDGAVTAGIISLILVSFILAIGVRSARLVTAAVLTLISGLIWTAAFAIFAIGYLNIISVAFAVLFIGLGVDFAIHFVMRYQEERAPGHPRRDVLQRTARGVGGALALCAPTTALAFYAFTPTAYAGLAQLGLISGTGIFVAFFGSLTLLPALISLFGPSERKKPSGRFARRARAFERRYGRIIAYCGIAAGIAVAPVALKAEFEFDPLKLKDPDTESVRTITQLLAESDSSPYTLQVLTESPEEAQELEARIEALAEVDKAVTLASFVPTHQDEKQEILADTFFLTPILLGDRTEPAPTAGENTAALAALRDALRTLPRIEGLDALKASGKRLENALTALDSDAQAVGRLEAQLMAYLPFTLDRLRASLEPGEVTTASLPADLAGRYLAENGNYRIEVFPADDLSDQDALRRFVEAVQTIAPGATGSPVQMVKSGDIVVDAMRQATITAFALILVFLAVILRSVRAVLLVLAPVVLAGILTAAATVWFGIPFNFANVIVLPLLIGLGVDSGIHLVLRAREEQAGEAVIETSTPRAVLFSTLTTIGSFGSLAISPHQGTASMGLLLTISILCILIFTLIVLPGMLTIWGPNAKKSVAKT